MKEKKILIKSFTVFLLILFVGCNSKTDNSPNQESGTPVKLTNPFKANLTQYITLNANTVFLKKEIVRASFQGFIEKIYKNIGDKISNGDLLFELKTKESAADKDLRIPIENKPFSGVINIYAKSPGVLTELNFNTGDFVSDGEQIAVISDPSSLKINLNVPYQYSNEIKMNSPCEIFLPDGKVVKASVQKIIPMVDPASQTQTYILGISQTESLPENLNINARIALKTEKDAIVLPKSSVMTNETMDKYWIMKLIDDNTAVRVDITKGVENDSLIQIQSPQLNSDERIILEGAFGMSDTAKVIIEK